MRDADDIYQAQKVCGGEVETGLRGGKKELCLTAKRDSDLERFE